MLKRLWRLFTKREENKLSYVHYKCPNCGDVYHRRANSCFCGWSKEFHKTEETPVLHVKAFLDHLAGLKELANNIGYSNWVDTSGGGYKSARYINPEDSPALQQALKALNRICFEREK